MAIHPYLRSTCLMMRSICCFAFSWRSSKTSKAMTGAVSSVHFAIMLEKSTIRTTFYHTFIASLFLSIDTYKYKQQQVGSPLYIHNSRQSFHLALKSYSRSESHALLLKFEAKVWFWNWLVYIRRYIIL